jgi:hemoglobin-like flavoprotein
MPDPNPREAPMTPEQIQIVKTSFAAVAPIAEQAGMMFYDRLFTVDPSLRPLFKGDIKKQSRALMRMIAVAVNGLDQLDTIVPAVQALGVRHAGYGVTNAHYDTVAGALLWTLGQGLGDTFTPEVEAAWVEAYTLLATTMQAAAREAA